jgi:uncharacterized protein YqjF (DUF2071 family)
MVSFLGALHPSFRHRPHISLQQTGHRPWALPTGNWILQQEWNDLTFLHWEIRESDLRPHLPPSLEIDTYGGSAWIGVVPFAMKGVTPRGIPPVHCFSDFPEINVRTYVRAGGKPGVWFFSLDVPSRLAVGLARTFFHLPYFHASFDCRSAEESVTYRHRRGVLEFDAVSRPVGTCEAPADSFACWATERYCLYCADRRGRVYRGEVHHPRWPLERAAVEIRANRMLHGWRPGPMHPDVLFSRHVPVVVWPLAPIG